MMSQCHFVTIWHARGSVKFQHSSGGGATYALTPAWERDATPPGCSAFLLLL